MPLGYHNNSYQDSGDPPGLAERKRQLSELQRDAEPSAEAGALARGAGGTAAAANIAHAKDAVNRQQRMASGAGLYKNGKFVGNTAP
jgi:hypothetical protein